MTTLVLLFCIGTIIAMIMLGRMIYRDVQYMNRLDERTGESWMGPDDFDIIGTIKQREIDRLQAKIERLEARIAEMMQAEHVAEVYCCSVYPNSEGEYVSEVTSKERLSVGAELYILPPYRGE